MPFEVYEVKIRQVTKPNLKECKIMKTLTSKILSAVLTGALALGVAGCAQPAANNDNGLKTVEAGKLTMATNAFFPP